MFSQRINNVSGESLSIESVPVTTFYIQNGFNMSKRKMKKRSQQRTSNNFSIVLDANLIGIFFLNVFPLLVPEALLGTINRCGMRTRLLTTLFGFRTVVSTQQLFYVITDHFLRISMEYMKKYSTTAHFHSSYTSYTSTLFFFIHLIEIH